MSENNPIVIPDSNGAPIANLNRYTHPAPNLLIAREVGRELASEVLNRRASAGKKTAEEYKAMSDAESDSELDDMPITDSCDVVRYVWGLFKQVFFFALALLVFLYSEILLCQLFKTCCS